jgi:hypothetical protein
MASGRFRDDEVRTVSAPAGNDAYTGMLIISLAAMLLGCLLLLIEFFSYDGQTKPPQVSLPAAPARTAAPESSGGGAPPPPPQGGAGAPGAPGGGAQGAQPGR